MLGASVRLSLRDCLTFRQSMKSCLHWCAGLDARAAAIVMRVVRNIVDTGRTIACTIHQPAIDIFEVRQLSSKLHSS